MGIMHTWTLRKLYSNGVVKTIATITSERDIPLLSEFKLEDLQNSVDGGPFRVVSKIGGRIIIENMFLTEYTENRLATSINNGFTIYGSVGIISRKNFVHQCANDITRSVTFDGVNLTRYSHRSREQRKKWNNSRDGHWYQVSYRQHSNWWIREDFKNRREALNFIETLDLT